MLKSEPTRRGPVAITSERSSCEASHAEARGASGGDHAGYNETSFLIATRPELVEQDRLDENAPWYCRQNEEKNSWTANAEHGQAMVDAVVDTWVAKIDKER